MNAIGLNPIKLDAIGLDPIRMNAIRLGVPGDSSGSGRPYIDPELLSHVKMAISTWGKTNDDPDRTVLKDLSGNGNDMRLLNFGFTEGSGYGLSGTDFEGWLCTDGVDDIIESVKPVSEMLEGSNEITVVSIIHGIGSKNAYTNVLRESGSNYIRNTSTADGKTGIYGYTCKDTTKSIITDILGDKNDYKLEYIQTTTPSTVNSVFSVAGWRENNGSMIVYPVAYAGGFIANKVLTTDEINQIIAYFNLDRPGQIIKPQLYCNVKKQGITNDNHAEFNDQLIDFVGGHNIQLNNISWEGESGINSYPVVFGANKTWYSLTIKNYEYTLNPNIIHLTHINTATALQYTYLKNDGVISSINREAPAFKLKVTGLNNNIYVYYRYLATSDATTISVYNIKEDGIYDIPKSYKVTNAMTLPTVFTSLGIGNTDGVFEHDCNLTLEILPTIENALCLDGISDFGKATGLPVLKDYTVVADRKILGNNEGGTLSKSYSAGNGAFIFETGSVIYSFGTGTSGSGVQSKRMLSYLSKYIYNGNPVQAGAGIDSDSMWLGTLRDNDTRFAKLALRSLLLFSYSLSEFLLERQLRKYNAGTLYPDMIEWRPIVKSNIPYSSISYSVNPGEYIAEGSTVTITITLSNASDKLVGVSSNAISDISISGDNGVYKVTGKVTKSPQKISIVISSYLTMLGNDTLISNETLIKNE
jgi:hypothetical protein|nr:MAG TPA: hypothetical protein [Caudoviricetes sp.]